VIGPRIDHLLARLAVRLRAPVVDGPLPTLRIPMRAGTVRVHDSGGGGPCVVLAPDGPNVIEHYVHLIRLLSPTMRVVCFDFPGFGHSLPSPGHGHSLDEGADVALGVLDALGINQATLAFSRANGFYALRAAQRAPGRIVRVVLAQTPSMLAMHAWKRRSIPWPLGVPGLGQAAIWLLRERSAEGWYASALPKGVDPEPFRAIARDAFSRGACWCLASISQGLEREDVYALRGVSAPCTVVWGPEDRSHRQTDPDSLREIVPAAKILRFAGCGHFPDLEQPVRFAELLLTGETT
jgi:pimeloyl-ACP methyl ester carboxylesterase